MQDNPLSHRQPAMAEIQRQVIVERPQIAVAKGRPGDLGDCLLQRQQRLPGRAGDRGLVAGMERRRVLAAVAHVEFGGFHFVPPSAIIAAKVSLAICIAWLARGNPA